MTTPAVDTAAVTRILRRLARAHPAFEFSREAFGWKGCRWVAERTDRTAPGLHVVITDDLMEMHAAIRVDQERRATAAITSNPPGRQGEQEVST